MKREIDFYTSNVMRIKRLEKGWSQQQLADQMGISRSYVDGIENKKRNDKLNVYYINLLGEIFQCSPKDFLPEKPILEV